MNHVAYMVLLVLLLYGSCAWANDTAQPDDIEMSVTFLTKDGTVAAHEPLLARIAVTNKTEKPLKLPMLNCVELCNSTGNVVAAIPRPEVQFNLFYGVRTLKPGETYTTTWTISALYQFEKLDTYTLLVHCLALQDSKLVDIATGTAEIRAVAFDTERVTARCEEIFQAAYRPLLKYASVITTDPANPSRRTVTSIHQEAKNDIDRATVSRALRSVRHDLILPYWDWLAREGRDTEVCYALRQLGTPRALLLLETLAARKNDVGKAARAAMTNKPRAITMWDVGE